LDFQEQNFLLNNLNNEEVSLVLNEMSPDDRIKFFKDLPERVMKKFFNLLKHEEANNVKRLMTYKEGTAGSVMTTDFIELKKDMTARKALLALQENLTLGYARDIYSVYVTDENHKLIGSLSLQMLLKAPQDIFLKEIMTGTEYIKIDVNLPREEIAKDFSKYDLLDAPVVDKEGQLLGIITIDDVIDLVQREATKDIYEVGKMTGGKGEIISYSTARVGDLIKRRAGWLILLLMFDFLTGTVLKTFEHALSSVVALAFFIPMLLDTGGNAGAQTSITIIRGLATGDVTFKNIWKVAKLEILTGFLMAIIVGGVALLRALMLQRDIMISLVAGTAMFFIVILAILTGITLPFLSKKVGLDPAVLAGPITTSVVDVVGLIIYFKIAQFFLPVLHF
ncbi:MAG: magnesium transporter, partial [Candidatus Omnitrophota bacterium]